MDTNVFISSILFSGKISRLVELWQKGEITVLLSKPVLEEYVRVLSYPKFTLSQDRIKGIIEEELLPYIETVNVKRNVRAIKEDTEDNKFLSLALEGKADSIVSGDRILSLKGFKGIKITTPKKFLDHLDAEFLC